MSSIKYRLKAKTDNSQIYIRFSISRNQLFETKTGLSINFSDWKTIKKNGKIIDGGMPKQTSVENKNLQTKLQKLSTFILEEFNTDFSNGEEISIQWLKDKLLLFFNRKEKSIIQENLFINYLDNYIELRKLDSRTKSATDQKFIQLKTKIKEFESKHNKNLLISDFDKKLLLEFRNFLCNDFKMMKSSANRTLKNIKTVLLDARDNGKAINHQINSFKVETSSSYKVFLSFEEIEQIKVAEIKDAEYQRARDWLIIGVYTGQRVSDLLRMNTSMIFTKTDSLGNNFQFIELKQEKTGKEVTIPIHSEVQKIIDKYYGDFPPIFGQKGDSKYVLFNRYIKAVCEIAKINNIVKGKVFNEIEKRNEIVETEKWKLISSHVCRRSFATNFYGDKRFTTAQIMAITGHATESVFLSYIGKSSSDHALQTAKAFMEIENQKLTK